MAVKPVLNIAHRGASAYAPENTLTAFELALDMGADGLELDVQLTIDQQIVVMHDATLDRTTSLSGPLHERTLAELHQADAGNWYGPEFTGEKIPTLDEVIELIKGRGVLNIEIKLHQDGDLSIVPVLLQTLKSHDFNDVILTSFKLPAIRMVKELAPDTASGFLTMYSVDAECTPNDFEYLCPHYSALGAKLIQAYHDRGFKILSWTVNEEPDMRFFMEQGVAGIITNVPDVLKKSIKEQKKS